MDETTNLRDNRVVSIGVSAARRGWCTRDNVFNTLPWKEIERFRLAKRNRK